MQGPLTPAPDEMLKHRQLSHWSVSKTVRSEPLQTTGESRAGLSRYCADQQSCYNFEGSLQALDSYRTSIGPAVRTLCGESKGAVDQPWKSRAPAGPFQYYHAFEADL